MTGFLTLLNTRNGESDKISYFDILTDSFIRMQLLRKLETNHDLKLYCCCSPNNDKEVLLSSDGKLQFPKGIPHSSICVKNLQQMFQLVEGALSPFILKGGAIPVSFTWTAKGRRGLKLIDERHHLPDQYSTSYDMEMLAEALNALSFQKTMNRFRGQNLAPEDFVVELQKSLIFDISRLTLKDPKNEELSLSVKSLLTPKSPANGTYFVYGKILSIDERSKKSVYIRVKTISDAELTITVDQSLWNNKMEYIRRCSQIKEAELWICGLVETKLLKSYKQGTYDSFTRMTTEGEMTTYKANKLRHGALFFTNDYGLLCSNIHEFRKSNDAIRHGYLLTRAFLPVPSPTATGSYVWERPYAIFWKKDEPLQYLW